MSTVKQQFMQQNLEKQNTFAHLQRLVAEWQRLTAIIQPYLADDQNESTEQWQVVCYQHGVLTLSGQNHAHITKIRYLQQQYIARLKRIPELADLEKIVVTQQPLPKQVAKKYTKVTPLSNEICQNMQTVAKLIQNEKLKKALNQVANQHNRLRENDDNQLD